MSKKTLEVWTKLFGNNPQVWLLWTFDPNDDEYQNPILAGVFATKKAAIIYRQEVKEKLYWTNKNFKINRTVIQF